MQQDVVAIELPGFPERDCIGNGEAVGDDGTLGLSRCARRVHDRVAIAPGARDWLEVAIATRELGAK